MIIDTLLGKRLHLLLILQLKTREIVKWGLTESPCREFVRQQIIMFTEELSNNPILIHDNASVFSSIDYKDYEIKGVNTCIASPNMNAFVERLNGSIRREALDHFLLFSQKQVRQIIKEYVTYYNHQRPHQGTNRIPAGIIDSQTSESSGTIMMVPLPMRVNNQRLFQEFALQTPRSQGNIPLSLKRLRSFQRHRTAKAVLGSLAKDISVAYVQGMIPFIQQPDVSKMSKS